MIITLRSLINFFLINGIAIIFGFILKSLMFNFIFIFIGNLIKNIILYLFLLLLQKDKPNIKHNFINNRRNFKLVFNILLVSLFDSITFYILTPYLIEPSNIFYDLSTFIINSFVFEIIFDLFHYIMHRTLHHKLLYHLFHKKHHLHHHTTLETTFNQDPVDLLLTNVVPIVFTFYLYPLSKLSFHLFMIYKTFLELSGHSGKIINGSSFCQFIWLPKTLGIELNTEDHYLHHTHSNSNYSKRFKLWDLIFNTYKAHNYNLH
ncbi:putative fatty acid hydroxylase [Cafeteria roenbergensis virus]|uniref:Putative fatty acid hydroxylase n=1 Tax=Cafeteria roenbergensis virus (strain BV-PW1) TaxID=693272 RepID=E3T4P0_CROVB|nr:putative fatty acid hydroxylase [Cafeteria roenbergensis virus BV-PW1]ADO67153.1 putative fatty acid hydroxylase [Cafeteria roenbergensis virus BV-PW1]